MRVVLWLALWAATLVDWLRHRAVKGRGWQLQRGLVTLLSLVRRNPPMPLHPAHTPRAIPLATRFHSLSAGAGTGAAAVLVVLGARACVCGGWRQTDQAAGADA